MPIIIKGPIAWIGNNLFSISAAIKNRKYNGWPPFQPDERWIYTTEQDENVCPVCDGFGNTEKFNGDEIPPNFPTEEQINPLFLIRPRVHEAHRELLGVCRCTLTWLNAREVLIERLNQEMINAVIFS